MPKIKLGARDALGMSQLLGALSKVEQVPDGLRRDAARLAGLMQRKMDQHDLRRVAWLFRDASGLPSVPLSYQDDARFWAAYLEGRLEPL